MQGRSLSIAFFLLFSFFKYKIIIIIIAAIITMIILIHLDFVVAANCPASSLRHAFAPTEE